MAVVAPILHPSHEVLNPDFCSGYIDAFGKWNTGFPCPWLDSAAPGFCCGTDNYKYCCSGNLRLVTSPPAHPNSSEDPLLLVLAITLGVAAGITLLILVACFVCPGCLLHKKRRPGPLYRLPCSSTMSTYVPTGTTGTSGHHHQHDGRTRGSNEVRSASSSFHSFSNGAGNGSIIPSFYSLSEPLCPETGTEDCHHLYWARAPVGPRLSNSGGNLVHHQQQHAPVYHQGRYGTQQTIGDSPSLPAPPPPPYDSNGPPTTVRQQHVSPRQPALCIIDDIGRRNSSGCHHQTAGVQSSQPAMMTYHSTKF